VTCEKITYLIEKGYLTRLNISEKLQVKLHTYYCTCCTNYPKDSIFINKMLAQLDENEGTLSFTAQEKEELKKNLIDLNPTN